jgi:hypothetical protein
MMMIMMMATMTTTVITQSASVVSKIMREHLVFFSEIHV